MTTRKRASCPGDAVGGISPASRAPSSACRNVSSTWPICRRARSVRGTSSPRRFPWPRRTLLVLVASAVAALGVVAAVLAATLMSRSNVLLGADGVAVIAGWSLREEVCRAAPALWPAPPGCSRYGVNPLPTVPERVSCFAAGGRETRNGCRGRAGSAAGQQLQDPG